MRHEWHTMAYTQALETEAARPFYWGRTEAATHAEARVAHYTRTRTHIKKHENTQHENATNIKQRHT